MDGKEIDILTYIHTYMQRKARCEGRERKAIGGGA